MVRSKLLEYKDEVAKLRDDGYSFREIAEILKIPKSTLSGWFSGTELTEGQKELFKKKWNNSLVKARVEAVKWHRLQKENRLEEAEKQASLVLSRINLEDRSILELALAMLYLGEGAKTKSTTMGNSNPKILRFFIASLVRIYGFDRGKIKCELHLRSDQSVDEMKKYWSRELEIPFKNFYAVQVDKRVIKRPTFPSYMGVCVVQCGNIAIQRRLLALAHRFCRGIVDATGFEPVT